MKMKERSIQQPLLACRKIERCIRVFDHADMGDSALKRAALEALEAPIFKNIRQVELSIRYLSEQIRKGIDHELVIFRANPIGLIPSLYGEFPSFEVTNVEFPNLEEKKQKEKKRRAKQREIKGSNQDINHPTLSQVSKIEMSDIRVDLEEERKEPDLITPSKAGSNNEQESHQEELLLHLPPLAAISLAPPVLGFHSIPPHSSARASLPIKKSPKGEQENYVHQILTSGSLSSLVKTGMILCEYAQCAFPYCYKPLWTLCSFVNAFSPHLCNYALKLLSKYSRVYRAPLDVRFLIYSLSKRAGESNSSGSDDKRETFNKLHRKKIHTRAITESEVAVSAVCEIWDEVKKIQDKLRRARRRYEKSGTHGTERDSVEVEESDEEVFDNENDIIVRGMQYVDKSLTQMSKQKGSEMKKIQDKLRRARRRYEKSGTHGTERDSVEVEESDEEVFDNENDIIVRGMQYVDKSLTQMSKQKGSEMLSRKKSMIETFARHQKDVLFNRLIGISPQKDGTYKIHLKTMNTIIKSTQKFYDASIASDVAFSELLENSDAQCVREYANFLLDIRGAMTDTTREYLDMAEEIERTHNAGVGIEGLVLVNIEKKQEEDSTLVRSLNGHKQSFGGSMKDVRNIRIFGLLFSFVWLLLFLWGVSKCNNVMNTFNDNMNDIHSLFLLSRHASALGSSIVEFIHYEEHEPYFLYMEANIVDVGVEMISNNLSHDYSNVDLYRDYCNMVGCILDGNCDIVDDFVEPEFTTLDNRINSTDIVDVLRTKTTTNVTGYNREITYANLLEEVSNNMKKVAICYSDTLWEHFHPDSTEIYEDDDFDPPHVLSFLKESPYVTHGCSLSGVDFILNDVQRLFALSSELLVEYSNVQSIPITLLAAELRVMLFDLIASTASCLIVINIMFFTVVAKPIISQYTFFAIPVHISPEIIAKRVLSAKDSLRKHKEREGKKKPKRKAVVGFQVAEDSDIEARDHTVSASDVSFSEKAGTVQPIQAFKKGDVPILSSFDVEDESSDSDALTNSTNRITDIKFRWPVGSLLKTLFYGVFWAILFSILCFGLYFSVDFYAGRTVKELARFSLDPGAFIEYGMFALLYSYDSESFGLDPTSINELQQSLESMSSMIDVMMNLYELGTSGEQQSTLEELLTMKGGNSSSVDIEALRKAFSYDSLWDADKGDQLKILSEPSECIRTDPDRNCPPQQFQAFISFGLRNTINYYLDSFESLITNIVGDPTMSYNSELLELCRFLIKRDLIWGIEVIQGLQKDDLKHLIHVGSRFILSFLDISIIFMLMFYFLYFWHISTKIRKMIHQRELLLATA
ncbi:hypothetical protein ADUPG1_006531 [Aduncisulcus paluster]|uniref:Uncharacterized protein n=1 Tax=Aduncisulcus paluster TaxID=2918883 RepID=A0ABQ5KM11_9EUKA|nr:hypothetical protein ADUPG1_006531 [Aduncisulcus paluster]